MTLLELLRRLHELSMSVCVGNRQQCGVILGAAVLKVPLVVPKLSVIFTRGKVPERIS